jgi:hypothetical protein
MARIRSIKPEYWSDERMATVGLEARLLFIGLLNLADDEGRLRGHPALIRGALFPYDDLTNAQVAGWLEELEAAGRIQRYQADGESFVWVRNFGKHQKIDHPSASKLPAPPAESSESPRELSRALASPREKSPRSREQGAGIGAGSREETSSPPPAAAEGAADALVAFWNEKAHPKLARVRSMTSNRKTALRARLKEHRLEELQEAIVRLGASSFCLGGGAQGWVADLDWLLRPGSVAKVLEGKYDDRGASVVPLRVPCVHDECGADSTCNPYGNPLCDAHAREHEAHYRGAAG